ncbi:MAG: phage head-tail connector protein [Rhodospirillaceae bacterium]|nr:MAG: phage head-tail connector protein [Rhodospirillaceae bacterium]
MLDNTTLRKRLTSRYEALKAERAPWEPHWRELADLTVPWMGRFDVNPNRGGAQGEKIYDGEATRALDTLVAGLTSGLAGPSRPWFRLGLPDPELSDYQPVREWLDVVEETMQWVFQRTNTYRALSSAYAELGLFGTAVTLWQPDREDFMRGSTLTAGEYWLANGENLEVDTLYRRIRMTVAQMVKTFGLDQVSQRVRTLWDKGTYDEWVTVIHALEPNIDWAPRRLGPEGKRWLSVYWEEEETKSELLTVRGTDVFPVTAPRWNALLYDVYGRSPAMRALQDIRQLQTMELTLHMALQKEFDPPLIAPSELANAGLSISTVPAAINYLPTMANGLQPLYQVRPDIASFSLKIEEIRRRIQSGFHADLFLAVTYLDRREITAREIDVRQEEKLIALGPVLERLHHGLLERMIDFTMDLMLDHSLAGWRTGGPHMLPPPPPELESMELQVDFISPLAQAQRAVGLTAFERLAAFMGNIAGIDPSAARKINWSKMGEEYSTKLGVTSKILRSDEELAAEQAAAAQQQQMQQVAQMGLAGVKGAELLSKTEVGGGQNALQLMMGR